MIVGEAEKLSGCTIRETLARTSASTRCSAESSLSPKDCAVCASAAAASTDWSGIVVLGHSMLESPCVSESMNAFDVRRPVVTASPD